MAPTATIAGPPDGGPPHPTSLTASFAFAFDFPIRREPPIKDVILGLVQGVTEFLPISSSGHLVTVPAMLGWDEPALGLTVMLHLGTLVSLLIYFRADLLRLANGLLGKGPDPAGARRLARLLVIATIPAAIAGVVLGDFFEASFDRPYQTCAELLLTAALLIAVERLAGRAARRTTVDDPTAAAIGVAQAVAILPGISRSGATIGAGLFMGLTREEATRFSFLLSIPAIAGAGLLDVAKGDLVVTGSSIAGAVTAGIAGYLSIAYLIRFVRTHSLNVFAYYLIVAAPLYALLISFQR